MPITRVIKINFYNSFFTLLLILLLVSISYAEENPIRGQSYTRAFKLASSFSFEQILGELSEYPWDQENDPALLMIYCEALVETGNRLPSNLNPPNLTFYKSAFTRGYFDLLRGNLGEAMGSFTKITENQEGRVWGYIGLMEYALHTDNIAGMEDLIESLKATDYLYPSSVPSWAIPTYSAWYFYYSGKFPEVNRVIRECADKLDPISKLILKVNLLLREDKFIEAKKVIKKEAGQYLNDPELILLEDSITWLEFGPEMSVKYLDEKQKLFPHIWPIEKEYGESLIETGQTKSGIKIIKKLAKKRPYDIWLQLDLVKALMDYEINEEEKNILSSVFNNLNYNQLPSYNIFLSQIYFAKGMDEVAQKRLNLAKELYPKYIDVFWLTYYVAMEKHDYEKAYKSIQEIIKLEPNSVPALAALVKLYYLTKKWDELFKTEKKIKHSNRYISVEIWDEVHSFKALALAAQGKLDEANDILKDIKKTSVRKETISKIAELKNKQ